MSYFFEFSGIYCEEIQRISTSFVAIGWVLVFVPCHSTKFDRSWIWLLQTDADSQVYWRAAAGWHRWTSDCKSCQQSPTNIGWEQQIGRRNVGIFNGSALFPCTKQECGTVDCLWVTALKSYVEYKEHLKLLTRQRLVLTKRSPMLACTPSAVVLLNAWNSLVCCSWLPESLIRSSAACATCSLPCSSAGAWRMGFCTDSWSSCPCLVRTESLFRSCSSCPSLVCAENLISSCSSCQSLVCTAEHTAGAHPWLCVIVVSTNSWSIWLVFG